MFVSTFLKGFFKIFDYIGIYLTQITSLRSD